MGRHIRSAAGGQSGAVCGRRQAVRWIYATIAARDSS